MPDHSHFSKNKLLLIDLDGVLVTEGSGDTKIGSEIITVHAQLAKKIDALNFPVGILTHRSRGEAMQIINALKINKKNLLRVFTANDILFFGLRYKGLPYLIRNGTKKSIILSHIVKHHKIATKNIAFIDDRSGNVEDMLNAGIGLGIHVPAARMIGQTNIKTFDLSYVLDNINSWSERAASSNAPTKRINLQPITIALPPDSASGLIMKRKWSDIFGLGRTGLRFTRQLILKLF